MTTEQLTKATELAAQITKLETFIKSGRTQTCTWIEFTFGNGSSKAKVCDDEQIITKVRELIVQENEAKLALLKSEFEKI